MFYHFDAGAVTRVLIVDDHPGAAAALVRALQRPNMPFEVLCACSGPEALQAAHARPVNVLITDYAMPGMNGLELVEAMQREGRRPDYTILLTASELFDLDLGHYGINEYLCKPVEPERIQAMLGRIITELNAREISALPQGGSMYSQQEDIALISHELLNLLTGIVASHDLLCRVGPLNDQQKVIVARMNHVTAQMTGLLYRLRSNSRLSALQLPVSPDHEA